ncbi:MAG: ABC transporter permease subunit [Desulfuromonadaceae bacterium]|nr:ABC transporter permease subunit [Desulfuromonadaceae bacterium]MDD2854689.1 ABC transporter permease subunit [Desulfuromonadaceae bacterium]
MAKTFTDKSRRNDRIAEVLIRIGGIMVIVSVIWILVMISQVALPLFYPSSATLAATVKLPSAGSNVRILAVGSEEKRQGVFSLDETGTFRFFKVSDGSISAAIKAPGIPAGATKLVSAENRGKSSYNLLWDNGAVSAVSVDFSSTISNDGLINLIQNVSEKGELSLPPTNRTLQSFARYVENRGTVRVDHLTGDHIRVTCQLTETDFLGNETKSTAVSEYSDPLPGSLTALAVDSQAHYLYGGTDNGILLRWDISEPGETRLLDNISASEGHEAITSLALVLGDVSIAVGDAKGRISTWFPVNVSGSGADKRLTKIHVLRPNPGKVSFILPSPRSKTIFSSDSASIHADHMTSERNLLTIKSSAPVIRASISPKGNTLTLLDNTDSITVWDLKIQHPDISFGTLFGKVWYEGYDKPGYSWQSSSANDDYEPKMSLVPLVFGTIKATLFAMLFAVPLALLAALYTSQFMSPKLKGRVKPVVEIMAAIPSVVIGFLAGLWLAPLVDKSVLTIFLSIIIVPLMLLLTIFFWKRTKRASPLQRVTHGREFIAMIPVVLLGFYFAALLSTFAEAQLFAGDFKQWLFNSLEIRYDQRNSIIIAIALGFAVIPIIFTIAEDAISNVPRNLTAASLALGGSRWQTAWRVVLPSALPGVFSAVMIGFGRAIGETMIVLMATGNTPIMSWSLFNGLRSLSANIAVEIPEAPFNSSLYRVLFLSAVLLFVFTFIVNTLAEALRQRFRKKYGRY